jgi:hypothetical protein
MDRAERTVYEPRVALRRIESALVALGDTGRRLTVGSRELHLPLLPILDGFSRG